MFFLNIKLDKKTLIFRILPFYNKIRRKSSLHYSFYHKRLFFNFDCAFRICRIDIKCNWLNYVRFVSDKGFKSIFIFAFLRDCVSKENKKFIFLKLIILKGYLYIFNLSLAFSKRTPFSIDAESELTTRNTYAMKTIKINSFNFFQRNLTNRAVLNRFWNIFCRFFLLYAKKFFFLLLKCSSFYFSLDLNKVIFTIPIFFATKRFGPT
jgi:hypothetical protein